MRQSNFLDGQPIRPGGFPDASWYDAAGKPVDWARNGQSLTCLLAAQPPDGPLKPPNHHLLILFHAGADSHPFPIPELARRFTWWQFIDTAAESPADVYPGLDGPAPPSDGLVRLEGRSLVCYVARDEL